MSLKQKEATQSSVLNPELLPAVALQKCVYIRMLLIGLNQEVH